MRTFNLLLALGCLMVGLMAGIHLTSRAQGQGRPAGVRASAPDEAAASATQPAAAASVQDALLRPFRFVFKPPVALADLAPRLSRDLGCPVVLDLAALERLDLKPEDTVTLGLEGVRLKTGLKLLLDQVGMTYRVVAEDNLLILTDKEGAEDPVERLSAEVRELHRDVHEVQDSLDEVLDLLGPGGDGARVRKPTIIEELPENAEAKPEGKPQGQGARPDSANQGPNSPRPRTRL